MRHRTAALAIALFACAGLVGFAQGAPVLFDFDDPTLLHRPLPLDLTVDGITAHLSATGQGFSIQDTQQVIGVLPAGFSGQGIVPSSISAADLLVGFSTPITDFSIMFAPQELATDSSATMQVRAYQGTTQIGSSTSIASPPGTWPSGTLTFASPQGFDNVVVHYLLPPPTGGDFGTIFVADNMIVTAASQVGRVPEPGTLALAALALAAVAARAFRRR